MLASPADSTQPSQVHAERMLMGLTLHCIIDRFERGTLCIGLSLDHGEHELQSVVIGKFALILCVAVQTHAQRVEQILQILRLLAVGRILLAIFLMNKQ